jgi:hypothetical protein
LAWFWQQKNHASYPEPAGSLKAIFNMIDQARHFARAAELSSKLAKVFQTRAAKAREHFKPKQPSRSYLAELIAKPMSAWDLWLNYYSYAVDCAKRSILYWDTLRQRGNHCAAARG